MQFAVNLDIDFQGRVYKVNVLQTCPVRIGGQRGRRWMGQKNTVA